MSDKRIDFKKDYYIFDGALGTMLQERGLKPGACPEEMNLLNEETVMGIHREYSEAGADFLTTNSFGGNRYKLEEYGLAHKTREINIAAAVLAKRAGGNKSFVAGSVGPTGRFLLPLGDMEFDQAREVFAEQIAALAQGGVDCIIFETFNDLGELRAGVIAAKEVCQLPLLVSLTYEKEKTLTGVSPESAAIVLEALGVDAIGANCSGGPAELFQVLKKYRQVTDLPLLVEPNAGLPQLKDGKVYFPLKAKEFMEEMEPYFSLGGIKIFGSCCGSTPQHTAAYKKVLARQNFIEPKEKEAKKIEKKLASKSRHLFLGQGQLPKLIGERINPTARKKMAESILRGDLSLLQEDAYSQTEKGAHLLDINLGMAGIDQKEKMREVINLIQQSIDSPLVIDSTDPKVIEEALKYYQGKALINSINGEEESMVSIMPLVKKYGAAFIALALDEKGIPETSQGRLEVIERIYQRALDYGISANDIYADCLVMTLGTDHEAARETLETIKLVKDKLGLSTVLGVSNVSHGLPQRGKINASFLAIAIYQGLDLAIVNPENKEMIDAWQAASLIAGRDPNASHYIGKNSLKEDEEKQAPPPDFREVTPSLSGLSQMVVRGTGNIVDYLEILLAEGLEATQLINEGLIPGLNLVGDKFEKGQYYLPQLMLSAQVSQKAFDYLEDHLGQEEALLKKGKIILGTVKGDVHDIGKNMVAVMVKNHGYEVIDLGKNVSKEEFMAALEEHEADFIGLSALMTTTMIQIPEVVEYIKEKYPNQKIICGGAVVTEDYARDSGTDAWCRDAVHAVNIMENLKGE